MLKTPSEGIKDRASYRVPTKELLGSMYGALTLAHMSVEGPLELP